MLEAVGFWRKNYLFCTLINEKFDNWHVLFYFRVTINYKVKLHRIPPSMIGGRCYFAWQDAKAVVKHLRQFRNVIQQSCFAASIILHIGKTRYGKFGFLFSFVALFCLLHYFFIHFTSLPCNFIHAQQMM